MRGQVKMFETVGVLVVFFFLLGIGSLFYFGAQRTSLAREQVVAAEQQAFQIVLKALYLPELDCSFLVTQKDNCIDKLKMEQLAKLMAQNDNAKQDYFAQFGFAKITVGQKYPVSDESELVLYSNVPSEIRTVGGVEREVESFTSRLVTQSPILLYDAIRDEYGFGVIEVSVYV